MNIIGLGQCGCNIAKCFEQYSQYDVYFINTEKVDSKNFFLIPKQETHENYETNCPDLSKFFNKVKGEVLFFLGGSGTISGSVLRILEYIKNSQLAVVFVMPDIELLSKTAYLQNRAVFFILQEYARSGLLEKLILLDNVVLEETISDLTILTRYKKMNETIHSTIHMLNVFDNQEPILGTSSKRSDIARICAIGQFDMEENLENLFFSLDNVSEKCYYYAIPQKRLEEDTKLLKMITAQVKEKTDNGKIRVSYKVYPTDYDKSFCYVTAYSSQVQKSS